LSDIDHEGTFLYLDGEPATAENTGWKVSEPNDSEGNEDCGHLNYPGHSHNTANDTYCTRNISDLCEKPLPICS